MTEKSEQASKDAGQGRHSAMDARKESSKAVASERAGTTGGTPIGDCTPDEPVNTLPAEPVSIAKVKRQK